MRFIVDSATACNQLLTTLKGCWKAGQCLKWLTRLTHWCSGMRSAPLTPLVRLVSPLSPLFGQRCVCSFCNLRRWCHGIWFSHVLLATATHLPPTFPRPTILVAHVNVNNNGNAGCVQLSSISLIPHTRHIKIERPAGEKQNQRPIRGP